MINLPRDPSRLPSMPVAQRQHFPKTAGLYFVIANRKILYIGKTGASFRRRWCGWSGHHEYGNAVRENAMVHFWELKVSPSVLERLETKAIRIWSPAWNDKKKIKGKRPRKLPAPTLHLWIAIALILIILMVR